MMTKLVVYLAGLAIYLAVCALARASWFWYAFLIPCSIVYLGFVMSDSFWLVIRHGRPAARRLLFGAALALAVLLFMAWIAAYNLRAPGSEQPAAGTYYAPLVVWAILIALLAFVIVELMRMLPVQRTDQVPVPAPVEGPEQAPVPTPVEGPEQAAVPASPPSAGRGPASEAFVFPHGASVDDVPIVGQIAAGRPIVMSDEVIGYVSLSSPVIGDVPYYLYRIGWFNSRQLMLDAQNYRWCVTQVIGNSMNNFQLPICNGDYVLLRQPLYVPYSPNAGDIVAAVIPDIDRVATLKRLKVSTDDQWWLEAVSDDPNCKTSYPVTQETDIVAVAIGVLKPIDAGSQ